MSNLKILTLGFVFFILAGLQAQDNRTLVTIDSEDITVDDFMYVYQKNNTLGDKMDKKSVDEYLDLYINFKLKVKEAEALGYDTVKAFQDELAGYRKQLAEPYFVNEQIIDELLVEAYERKKLDIRASHILIKVGPNAIPEDTLAAYNKISAARDRVLSGEDFNAVAAEISEDPSARPRKSPRGGNEIPGNGGDLGYFSVFDMVYPFENGAYNTPKGKISNPIRSDFGYHIIKVTDIIPAQGSIEAAHLFLQVPDTATEAEANAIEEEITSLYDRIIAGENFEDLVKEYSDDKGSATRGGLLPKFNVNRMVPEFIETISMMQDSGDISKPVLTSYGWHIIKLHSKTGIQPFDKVKDEMEKRLEKDSRAQKSKSVIIQDIKKEYNYKVFPEAIAEIYPLIDSSIYKGKWEVPADVNFTKSVFNLGEFSYTQQSFVEYIASNQDIAADENISEFVNKKFKEISDVKCRNYYDSKLEGKYPEFKSIVQEYRDGILLFELTNDKIWNFASKDTLGLKAYYTEHQKEFMWDERVDASIFTMFDSTYVDKVRELAASGVGNAEILEQINNDSTTIVKIERKKFQKNENNLIDSIKLKKGLSENTKVKGKVTFVHVHGKIPPETKTFDEARGLITAGYQEKLEEEWIAELRGKYIVAINEEVLNSLTN
ncbi:MAG: peptidylprolyl isomerase [Bacteroidales bacterium]